MSTKTPIGDKEFLQRRVKTNPKFSGAQPVVASGMTKELSAYMQENKIKLKRQPGELFKRVLAETIGKFIADQVEPVLMSDGGFAKPMDEYRGSAAMEYLVLDCRSEEDFQKCHILGALHYSRIRINHSTNPFLPEMYAVKNKDKRLIVLYDLEEEAVPELANVLYQKGIDNIAIIAGGFREFVQEYSKYLVGECPVPILPRNERMKRRADEATLARSEARSTASHKPKSLSTSLAKPGYRRDH